MSELTTVEQKASYGIGLQVGQQLASSGLTNLNPAALAKGIEAALAAQQPEISIEEINQALGELHQQAEAVRQQAAAAAAAEGDNFLAENAKRAEVTTTESGLQYEVLATGKGQVPSSSDMVRVHYHGTLINGDVFDSSVARNQPAEFPVTGVIKGWVEALQMMPVGSKWKLYIPHELAYGERGAGASIAPYSALIFEVELLDII